MVGRKVELDRFALSPLAEPLRAGAAPSLRDALRFEPAGIRAWATYERDARAGTWRRPEPACPDAASADAARLLGLADETLAFDIRLASDLRIPDRLAAGAGTADELADEVGAGRRVLRPVLRALAARGVLSEETGGSVALAPPSAEITAPGSGCARSSTTTPRNSAGVTDASWRMAGGRETGAPCAKDVAGLLNPATITSTASGRTLTSYALRRHHREIDALGDRLARRLVGNLDFQPVIAGCETDERHLEEIRDAC